MWYWICLILVFVFSIGHDLITDEFTWPSGIWWTILAVIPGVNVIAAVYLIGVIVLYHGMSLGDDDDY